MKFSMYDNGWTMAEDEGGPDDAAPSAYMQGMENRVRWFGLRDGPALLKFGDKTQYSSGVSITVYGGGPSEGSSIRCQRLQPDGSPLEGQSRPFRPCFVVAVRLGPYQPLESDHAEQTTDHEDLILVENLENLTRLIGELRPLVGYRD